MIKRLFQTDGELKPLGKTIMRVAAVLYAVAIATMCFLPQNVYPRYKDFMTPGIVQIGRLYLLPVPFNSIVNAYQVKSLSDWFWVVMQNMTNIFLLTPLIFCLLFLYPSWRNWRIVLRNTFFISLFIECTQLLLDILIDAGRVFEVDDLWTNSLGGLIAYLAFKLIHIVVQKRIGNAEKLATDK